MKRNLSSCKNGDGKRLKIIIPTEVTIVQTLHFI